MTDNELIKSCEILNDMLTGKISIPCSISDEWWKNYYKRIEKERNRANMKSADEYVAEFMDKLKTNKLKI